MPKNLTAVKRTQVSLRNNFRNKSYKSSIKTIIKKTLCKIDTTSCFDYDQVSFLVAIAYSRIDKAVKKGIIPKNTAARKKAMLAQKLKTFAKNL